MVSPAMPEDLTGNWTLTEMRTRGGAAIVTPASVISLRFDGDGTLSGYDECNNYFAPVNLTGRTTPDGSGITLGSVGSTKKYCTTLADQEQQYLNILGKTSAYAIDATRLTLTTTRRDVLIFRR